MDPSGKIGHWIEPEKETQLSYRMAQILRFHSTELYISSFDGTVLFDLPTDLNRLCPLRYFPPSRFTGSAREATLRSVSSLSFNSLYSDVARLKLHHRDQLNGAAKLASFPSHANLHNNGIRDTRNK